METINPSLMPGRSEVGKFGQSASGRPFICCINYDYPTWLPLDSLSSSNWMKYRENVAADLAARHKEYLDLGKKRRDNTKEMATVDKTRQMLQELYTKMTPDDKRTFLNTHKKSWLSEHTCTICLENCETKSKCIHRDCCGMCSSCHNKFTEEEKTDKCCPACNKPQKKMCPICQEPKSAEQLCEAEGGCGHSVCWKCFGLAVKAGHPLHSCPLCRGEFHTARRADLDFSDSESDDDTDDELEHELVRGPSVFQFGGALPQETANAITAALDRIHSAAAASGGVVLDIGNVFEGEEDILAELEDMDRIE